jgi:cell division protein FtsL
MYRQRLSTTMSKEAKKTSKTQAVIRFRQVAIWSVILSVTVTCPLFVVWKQVYKREMSIRETHLSDSLSVCNREIARLKMMSEKYSATPRIETIARERLGLDYPTADRIVVIDSKTGIRESRMGEWEFLAILKRSLLQDKRS